MKSMVFKAMGTTISLKIEHEFAELILEAAKERLLDYERRFSANDANSLLMKVNQAAGRHAVSVDADIYELVRFGKQFSLDSTNTLNIAIGPLIKLWRIGFDGARIPNQSEIDHRLKLIDPGKIILSDNDQSVYLTESGMEIDLGALAKGFFADKLKIFLLNIGVEKGIIDLGGNVLLIGSHPANQDGLWRIGIQDPFKMRTNTVGIVKVKDASIVTSGIYERSLIIDNEEYHHIFDSRTGYPIQNDIASVTILSPDSLSGELYTTLFYQYQSHEAMAKINEINGIEAIVITRDNGILLSANMDRYFVPNSEADLLN